MNYSTVKKDFADKHDVIDWMINNQLGRRNATSEKKSYLRGIMYENQKAKVGKHTNRANQYTKVEGGNSCPLPQKTAKKIAAEQSVSERTIKNDAQFAQGLDTIAKVSPELKEKVLQGESDFTKKQVSDFAQIEKERREEIARAEKEALENQRAGQLEAAQALAELEAERKTQAKLAELEAERKNKSQLIENELEKQKKLKKKQEKIEARKQDIQAQKEQIESSEMPVIDRKFDLIVIDPPWDYGREYEPDNSRVANPYPGMSIEEIKNISIPAKDDSLIWLWTTHKFLPIAFEILDKWGFEYKGVLTWDKAQMGMGYWLRMQCEFCLLGVKGNPVWDVRDLRDIFQEKGREHSRKPEAFYESINTHFPYMSKLEYFSRQKRDGWEVYGNEIDKWE